MRFIHNRQELEHTLILMHHEGRSIHELSRQFHLGRNTVRRILRAHAQRRDIGHDVLIPLRAGLKPLGTSWTPVFTGVTTIELPLHTSFY